MPSHFLFFFFFWCSGFVVSLCDATFFSSSFTIAHLLKMNKKSRVLHWLDFSSSDQAGHCLPFLPHIAIHWIFETEALHQHTSQWNAINPHLLAATEDEWRWEPIRTIKVDPWQCLQRVARLQMLTGCQSDGQKKTALKCNYCLLWTRTRLHGESTRWTRVAAAQMLEESCWLHCTGIRRCFTHLLINWWGSHSDDTSWSLHHDCNPLYYTWITLIFFPHENPPGSCDHFLKLLLRGWSKSLRMV